jgi:hypothetical protein
MFSDESIGVCEIQLPVELNSTPISATLKSIKRGSDHGTLHCVVSAWVRPPALVDKYHIVLSRHPARDPKTNYGVFPRSGLSFVDALQFMQLRTTCALDFTSSNGPMHDLKDTPNPYQESVLAVCEVLQDYDRSDKFELLGYGGAYRSHFPPFFQIPAENVFCNGLPDVLAQYKEARPNIQLGDMGSASGGDMAWRAARNGRYYCDDFYACINHVCDAAYADMSRRASQSDLPEFYRVLFLVIDGDGFDTQGTKRAIVRASALPVSIVLVGVGSSDFRNLSSFDADETAMQQDNVAAVRDPVQFVKFEACKANGRIDYSLLRSEVLREIPQQVEQFLAMYNLFPPPTQKGI